MKKLYAIGLCLFTFLQVQSQDLGVQAILDPQTGCNLSNSEAVTIRIYNYGSNMSGIPFNVEYTVNGGLPVVEVVVIPTFLTNSVINYTFTTPADLSAPGTYTFTARTNAAGDVNPTNDEVNGHIVNNFAPGVGGSVGGGGNFCYGSNSGTLTLSGHSGNIINWEFTQDGGNTWFTISNTSTTQNFTNLLTTTEYRARVQNGVCPPTVSSSAIVTIDPVTNPGNVTGTTTVCATSNSGTVTLSNHVGTVNQWISSTNGGSTWTNIANTGTSQNFSNLSQTTIYRAIVQSGNCPADTSTAATITVTPAVVGGSVAAADTVCQGANSGLLALSGHVGSVLRWEYSVNGGSFFFNVPNTSTNFSYLNLNSTTIFRALIGGGVCGNTYSSPVTITVLPSSVGGTTSGSATVCAGSNSGNITLAGNNGNIIRWESSINGGSSWTPIANTTATQAYNNLSTTTQFRAVAQVGACAPAFSSVSTITVNPVTVGGSLSGGTTVCQGANSGNINLTGQIGAVDHWEFTTDGVTWTTISTTSTSIPYNNLTVPTTYRAFVVSGVCPGAFSTTTTFNIDQPTVAGNVTSDDTVCQGNNTGLLTATGQTGNIIRWQFSTNGGASFSNISNTTNTHTFNNLNTTTHYRVQVQNGVCPMLNSSQAIITVDATSQAGTVTEGDTVCATGNSGDVQLVGFTGTINGWEESTDGGLNWNSISNNSAVQNYLNLTTTTRYRAIVQNGVCPADTSLQDSVYVIQSSIGGLMSPNALTVCAAANANSITLNGNVGQVVRWEYSTDGGNTWVMTTNNTNVQSFSNLSSSIQYRALVQSGLCTPAYSDTAFITVQQVNNAGTINGSAQVCDAGNSGTLTLTGNSGGSIIWETSPDGIIWTPNTNTSTSENYSNLTSTTYYRTIVQGGVCPDDTSNTATVLVTPSSVGGTITPSTLAVCSGSNSGSLTLSGHTGTIQGWEFSTDGGNTWISSSNNTSTQNYLNLTLATTYRARVQNAYCPSDYSSTASITIDTPNDAGSIIGNLDACDGINNDSLILSGYTGTLSTWESSTDGISWTPTGNSNDVEPYLNLIVSTYYRAIVQGGVCPDDTSNIVLVEVHPNPVAAFTVNDTCLGDTVSFVSGSTISSGSIASYSWNFGDASNSTLEHPNHLYASAGNFPVSLIVVSDQGCSDTATGSLDIFALPSAQITPSGDLTFCEPGSVDLNAVSGLNYNWSTGEITQNITVDSTQIVVLTVTDPTTGCSASSQVEVVSLAIEQVLAGRDTTISLGSSVQLEANGGMFFSWTPAETLNDPNSPYPTARPFVTTTYTVVATDQNGCVDSDSMIVTVNADFTFVIPNLITPNSDGYNDTWKINNIELYPDNEVVIFNRYGMTVFSASAYDNTWSGGDLPDGTYHYILRFNGDEKVFKGSLTILRGE